MFCTNMIQNHRIIIWVKDFEILKTLTNSSSFVCLDYKIISPPGYLECSLMSCMTYCSIFSIFLLFSPSQNSLQKLFWYFAHVSVRPCHWRQFVCLWFVWTILYMYVVLLAFMFFVKYIIMYVVLLQICGDP